MEAQSSALPPQPPPKESFARRYKFLWPTLLAVNLAVGGFMILLFFYPSMKGVYNKLISGPQKPPIPVIVEVELRESIPEDQQRELFKWMLEEKRKIKPKAPEEKKRID